MNETLLREADRVLNKCGRPVISGAVAVPLYRGFLMPMVLSPNESRTFTKEITGDVNWTLRAISSSIGAARAVTGVRIQIQLPNGRFLIGSNGQEIGQFAWIGSWRYSMGEGAIECEPGSKIQVTLTDTLGLGGPLAVNLLFEGAYTFWLRGAGGGSNSLASELPRYSGVVNENILAPCWVAGEGPYTPVGFEDGRFTYSSIDPETVDGKTAIALAGPLSATLKIDVDAGYDFFCRRVLVDVTRDDTATAGVFLCRLRTGSGSAFTDTAFDIAQYINGAEYPHDWLVRGDDSVYVDVSLADSAGSGNYYIQVHLEGARRRKK